MTQATKANVHVFKKDLKYQLSTQTGRQRETHVSHFFVQTGWFLRRKFTSQSSKNNNDCKKAPNDPHLNLIL